ncbi:MAG: hypothetical protein HN348_19015, partial [Proteobacteria bacterium]|nr:hypothetical protein [Pseudomonadota bacterium]
GIWTAREAGYHTLKLTEPSLEQPYIAAVWDHEAGICYCNDNGFEGIQFKAKEDSNYTIFAGTPDESATILASLEPEEE